VERFNQIKNKFTKIAQKMRVDYFDIRLEEQLHQQIWTTQEENHPIHQLNRTNRGFVVRLLKENCWGIESSTIEDWGEISDVVIETAVSKAMKKIDRELKKRARKRQQKKIIVSMGSRAILKGKTSTDIDIDPFEVDDSTKSDFLLSLKEFAEELVEEPVFYGFLQFYKTTQLFLNSEGADQLQTKYLSGGGFYFTKPEDEAETECCIIRSYPLSEGNYFEKGYEVLEDLELFENCARVAEEFKQLEVAPKLRFDFRTVAYSSAVMAKLLLRTIGDFFELDRIQAGNSFVDADQIGFQKLGTEILNVTANTKSAGAGHYFWDEEGINSQSVPLIRKGIITGYISSRDTASKQTMNSSGCGRADNYRHTPIVRVGNIVLEMVDGVLEDPLASIKDGYLLDGVQSITIDRYRYRLVAEIAYKITDGKVGKIYKNPVCRGEIQGLWEKLIAIGSQEESKLYGYLNEDKGDPPQKNPVGVKTPLAIFENIRLGE